MAKDVLETIRERRTTRKYADRDVADEQIETLLEMAMYAPTRLNRQPWRFVVIRDKALQKRVAEQLRIHPYLETAPVVIAVGGVPDAPPTWLMDVSAAIQNMLLAAEALGLGTAWVAAPGTSAWDTCERTLREAVGIPEEVHLAALVAVGHPAQKMPPHEREQRFDRTKIHYGKWGNLRLG